MSEKVTLEILTKSSAGGSEGSSTSSGSKKGGILGAIGGIAKMGIGVMALVTIAKDMLYVFKPVLSVISGITKMLGQFLQPIAEVLTIMLMPILQLLRPILEVFKSMMAPFMDLIRRLGVISRQQAAEGDTSGLMQTNALLLQAVFGPLFTVLASIVGNQLFDFAGLIGGFLIDGLYDVMIILGATIDSIFGTDLVTKLNEQRDNAKLALTSGIAILKDTLNNGIGIMLEDMHTNLTTKINTLGATLPAQLDLNVVKPFEDLVDKLSAAVKRKSSGSSSRRNTGNLAIDLSDSRQSPYTGSGDVLTDVRNPFASGGFMNPI